ncbi:MAG: hypothetical protein Q4P34_07785 [Tissierellia bacterium]|nr:hypothetical protein [Tissierellia bacterium]
MRILFSPVGNTDPISINNDKEGSLLQICRKYKPEKIYLYMSKEIIELNQRDNRYILFLEELYKGFDIELDYEIIARENLIDAHIFDYFYKDFRSVLSKIHRKHKNDEIYLNISSGTPAMKNALFILTAISDFKMIPVQVSTPYKRGNYTIRDYDLELYLHVTKDINDNPEKYIDRTSIAEMKNFNYELKKEIISNHLSEYNYSAALTVSETVREFLPEKSYNLINAALCRNNLDSFRMDRFLEKTGERFFLHKGKYEEEVEYMLYLDIIRRRGLILEFIRGITPLIYNLFIIVIETNCKIDIKDYFIQTKSVSRWNPNKFEDDENRILEILNSKFKNTFNINSIVYSSHLIEIIKEKGLSDRLIDLCEILRKIEEKARNKAAHQIISITDDFLNNILGYESEQIMGFIKKLCVEIDIGLTNEIWNSYNMMNDKIINSMNH